MKHRKPTPRKYTLMEVLKAWFTPNKHFNPYALIEDGKHYALPEKEPQA